MPTPLGGTRAKAFWFDQFGATCTSDQAVSGEIVEYDEDDVMLGRTYVDRSWGEPGPGQESDPSNEVLFPENADLLKMGSWDLWTRDWSKKIDTLAELLDRQDLNELPLREQRAVISGLMALPMWVAAPAQLKAEAEAWLGATIQE